VSVDADQDADQDADTSASNDADLDNQQSLYQEDDLAQSIRNDVEHELESHFHFDV
jgi:hypothetical protein